MKFKFAVCGLSFAVALALCAEGTSTIEDGVLTLDGLVMSVAKEADLGEGVTSVVMRNGGGVAFTASLTAANTYSIAGEGLAATGIVSVASGKGVTISGARLAVGAVGHTLVKRGAGTLYVGKVDEAAAEPTRFIVEEGRFQCSSGDFWGGHTTANTNCVIDVREGAVYDHGTSHGVVGPIELTGAQFLSRNTAPWNNQWADASLDGGVTAHASATASYMYFASWGFLGHCNRTNCVFNVEEGARLIVDGVLTNGFDNTYKNRLIKRGAGELVFLKNGGWTGGTVLEGGTIVVAHPRALSTGGITLAGDVTIKVLPGVTFECPPVTGGGTITKTGAGVATFPTVADGVTVTEAEAGTIGSPFQDGVVYLSGGEAIVDVPDDATATVTSFVETYPGLAPLTDIVKTGAGTLLLPTGSETKFRKLINRGGFVEVSAESCFGSGGVALEDGCGLRFTESFNQARARITCTGAVTLDVPEGVTLGVHSNYFVSTGATVTKTGGGTWQQKTVFRKDQLSSIDFTGTKWVIHEGKFKLTGGDNFCGAGGTYPLVIEVHEAGVLEASDGGQHVPLCEIVLRGGTMFAFYAQYKSSEKLESGATWKGFGLQGPITVLPSARPSRILARQCHLAHAKKRTVFDVQTGATLEIDTMLQPGRDGSNLNKQGFVKRGGGTLKLLKPVGTAGVIDVEDGTVELGPNISLNDNVTLNVSQRAKFVLGDGSVLATQAGLVPALCGSADVWFDAASLNLADGAAVSSVPNRGMSGGTFGIVEAMNGYTPTAPTFVREGINGLGSVAFDGAQALVTKAYTNYGARVSVFLVSKWTSWEASGGKGRWGGPLSLAALKPLKLSNTTGDDNQCYGALAYQNGNATALSNTYSTYGGDGDAPALSGGPSVNVPYLTHSGRDSVAKRFFTEVYWADGYKAGTNNVTGGCYMDTVCVGGRLRLGVPQIWGADSTLNRMYIGQIGEVLVFSRELTAEEEATILTYLKKKWFNAGALSQDDEKVLASVLPVAVPSGEAAVVAGTEGTVLVEKTGAGSLTLGGTASAFVDVQEGTLALRTGRLPSLVDIWVDASDNAGMTFDAAGRVTNLVNRGSCGGAFVRNARKSAVPDGPQWADDAAADHSINGRPALVFDGDSALALFSYTNTVAPRRISVYCIAERTTWELNPDDTKNGGGRGKWAGPFALGDTSATKSDEGVPGAVHVSETYEKQACIDVGSISSGYTAVPPTGEPYLLVFHSTTNGYLYAYETNATAVANVPRLASNSQQLEPFQIDIVQLATRTSAGGGPQWYGKGHTSNRSWYGKIGEFIVTTEPLGEEQEYELFAYLRKKWLNKGDGSATPPAWLSGLPVTPALGAETVLSMTDGTSLLHTADPVSLGGLATAGTVNWTRVWDRAGGDAAATLFNVDGDVALGAIALDLWPVPSTAKLVGFTGSALSTATWTVTGDTGAGNVSVSLRNDGYWLNRSGSVIYLR